MNILRKRKSEEIEFRKAKLLEQLYSSLNNFTVDAIKICVVETANDLTVPINLQRMNDVRSF
jgi:hypothetical protein